jgi:hypothetical protein
MKCAIAALALALALACSTSTTPGTGAADSALVGQCEALAQNFADKCAGDDVRPCLWAGYKKLCSTGQTKLLVDSMNCLDARTCRTFSDPNDGESCLQRVHGAGETPAAKAAITMQCSACGGTMCSTVKGTDEIFPYLTDGDLQATSSCAGTTGCTGMMPLPSACQTVPGLAPFACAFRD